MRPLPVQSILYRVLVPFVLMFFALAFALAFSLACDLKTKEGLLLLSIRAFLISLLFFLFEITGAKLCVNAQHNACAKCSDLTSTVHWAATNDEAAQHCSQHAQAFASALFSRRSLLMYLGEVLTQVARLQVLLRFASVLAAADSPSFYFLLSSSLSFGLY